MKKCNPHITESQSYKPKRCFLFCPEAPLDKDVVTPSMSRIQWQHLEDKALRLNVAHSSTHGFIHLPRNLEREETDAAAMKRKWPPKIAAIPSHCTFL